MYYRSQIAKINRYGALLLGRWYWPNTLAADGMEIAIVLGCGDSDCIQCTLTDRRRRNYTIGVELLPVATSYWLRGVALPDTVTEVPCFMVGQSFWNNIFPKRYKRYNVDEVSLHTWYSVGEAGTSTGLCCILNVLFYSITDIYEYNVLTSYRIV